MPRRRSLRGFFCAFVRPVCPFMPVNLPRHGECGKIFQEKGLEQMHRAVVRLTDYLVKVGLVRADGSEWVVYGLEKRLSTALVLVPFCLIAWLLCSPVFALSFFFAYYFLRRYTGGYHARTAAGCLCFSLALELLLIGCVPALLRMGKVVSVCFTVLCGGILFLFAPYCHPNQHLSPEEAAFCRKKVRLRAPALVLAAAVLAVSGCTEAASGLVTGIALAALLLSLGYMDDWRKKRHEEKQPAVQRCKDALEQHEEA